MPVLSLCMIVRDEERHIRRCLGSVKDVVDEIVVVDTGSVDRTADICRSYGADVYSFAWNDNFADARNFGLERARGDWILFLDADEEVEATDRIVLREALRMKGRSLMSLRFIHYFGDTPDPDRAFLLQHHRLFRNGLGIRFKHAIHETLDVPEALREESASADLPVRVHHYGYMDGETSAKNKFERNMGILEKELSKPDPDPWMDYYAASENYRIGDYTTALERVNRSILRFVLKGAMPPSLLYKLKYDMLLKPEEAGRALKTIDLAIRLHPDYVDLVYYKGVLLFYEKRYREALETFDRCLAMGDGDLRHLTLKGVGSFRALHYKAKCWSALGDLQRAAACCERAVALSPSFTEAAEDLKRLADGCPCLTEDAGQR